MSSSSKRRKFLKNAGSTALFASLGTSFLISCDDAEEVIIPDDNDDNNDDEDDNDNDELTDKLNSLEEKYKDQDIPRPDHWGGFIVVPDTIEFWQGHDGRLHDRLKFKKENDNWVINRLSP